MTYGWMKQQVQAWLGLQDSSMPLDESTITANLIYQGTLDLLARTRCVVRCIDLRVAANVSQYTLDHSLLTLVDVENGDRPRNRRDQTVGPSFTLVRSDVLLVKPTPSADGEIQVWAVQRPQQMTLDADSPGDEIHGAIPDEFQDAIVTYAMWKAADYADDQPGQNGEYYRVLYEGQNGQGGRLSQIRAAVNKRGTAKPPGRRVKLRSVSSSGAYTG